MMVEEREVEEDGREGDENGNGDVFEVAHS